MNEFIQTLSLGGTGPNIAIKDTIDIAGYATTAASRALADTPPAQRHAQVVERLLAAGWHIVGKTNMHELAFGMTGINDYTGTPQNPQDATRIPGGSSSGSAAAVGLKLADAALGTDTGGSIRGPAACCGVIGLKPTFGRVSRLGVAPRESTLDCVGPFARDMHMLAAAMLAIAADFDVNAAHAWQGPCKVGIVQAEATADILAAVARAADTAGCTAHTLRIEGLAAAFDAGLTVINAETSHAFGHLVASGKIGSDLDARLRAAANTTAAQVDAAEQVRRQFTAAVDHALDNADVLILPTLPALPITLEEARSGKSVIAMSSLIRPFNLSGHPALSLPLPVEGSPLKAGLQIIGRKGHDEQVCAIAARFEAALAA
ncbi:amidase, Asp-tRNAAsn/Glu-tRNAGln amidotransferase A subunit [Burkholderia sp. Ch1-1]|uniref:Amidase, Asp-tRNAAsn/Glu-tRNAGln amidotransferase A subunit n=1 Tax=Paraburkholderia dioscoreae TaxID=2604047 RepID=A0A5Q4ZA97_9BURK|nr:MULTISPECIES: amidase [Paraburkholderia]EIF31111.1 amidase, Asp-tRNAAsn/Glu-tRNAGln amidotransferase A subunit [Burkholderia sp. Ch1-1]MDR8401082.1 amidase [Paraburkholderia sp. USG1]VVD28697.1 Amidase, Asp-tRNAAsn/Glu-tRNAGln amidotransferase A subunit [Paraburkholderia dioscoreae]